MTTTARTTNSATATSSTAYHMGTKRIRQRRYVRTPTRSVAEPPLLDQQPRHPHTAADDDHHHDGDERPEQPTTKGHAAMSCRYLERVHLDVETDDVGD